MNIETLDDETYAILLGVLICNIEVDIKSSLFQSGNFLKPYGDGGKSIAVGFGLDLKVNSLNTITCLYKNIFGDNWQISNEEKDILEKLRTNAITTTQAIEKLEKLTILTLDLKTQDNAYKLFSLTLQSYENKIDNKISKSYERIALVSRAYNYYGELLLGAVRQQNRFLIWFYLRYTTNTSNGRELLGLTKRRWWESEIFKLYNGISFENILEIFQCLNIVTFNKKIIYKHIEEYEARNLTQENIQIFKNDSKNRDLDKHFKFTYEYITTILKPHLDYLNTLTQKNFSLDNIYCIANYCENLGANKLDNVTLLNKTLRQKFERLEANTLHNILILYPNPTPSIIQIKQPKNTFITLLIGAKAKIDCSKLIEDQCELMYLKYDPTQEEQQAINPQAFSCSTQEELTLKKEDEIYFKTVKNNISYFINKNDGILKVALAGNEENAIELYSFAKENQFKILQDKASKMLKIYLKLERYSSEEILSHRGGNFELTLNNLKILDENGNNHETIIKVFLHNCENRRIYESLKLEHQEGIYKSSFKIDLILNENSSFFKRATKCIIATKTLEGFSTSQIHKIGNVAIVSLSSADKKGGYYTFTNKVSMQDFGENLYLDTEANGYEKQIKNSRKNLYITSLQAYKEKEQQNTTDKIPYNETIFVRAYLNNEEKFFFDETIKWAYCVKKEEELECNQSKIKILENLQGNDITFNTSMLSQNDRNILYNMNEKYQLILFAYFNTPAFNKMTKDLNYAKKAIELTLSNIKDKEQIYLKAEKDYDELVQHNFTQRILNDKDSKVDGLYNERIKKVHTQTIDLTKNVNVGAEYLINVGLSKDTIVGLSNTLNVGVDNKVRVAKNSHEFVGENKDIEIGANQNTIIHKDETRNVKGENKLLIEKSLTQTIEKEFFLNVHQNLSAHIQDNTSLKSNSMQTKVEEQYSLESDNSTFDFQTDCEVKAGNQILHQVGNTQIVTKKDCVIIKAGGVEVIIDSKGLVVRGGEIRAE